MKKLMLMSLVVSGALLAAVSAKAEPCNVVGVTQGHIFMVRQSDVNANDPNACHEFTYRVGDDYCNGLRAGQSGPNPVALRYFGATGANWQSWIFGCNGVPQRN